MYGEDNLKEFEHKITNKYNHVINTKIENVTINRKILEGNMPWHSY